MACLVNISDAASDLQALRSNAWCGTWAQESERQGVPRIRSVMNLVEQQDGLFKNSDERKQFRSLYEWVSSNDFTKISNEARNKTGIGTQVSGALESVRQAAANGLGVVMEFLADSISKNPLLGAIGKRLYPRGDLEKARTKFRATSQEFRGYLNALISGKVGLPDVWRRMQKLGVSPIAFTSTISKLSERRVQELDQGNLRLVPESAEGLSLGGGWLLDYSPSTLFGAIGMLLVLVGFILGVATVISAGMDPTGQGSAALAISFIVVAIIGFAGVFIDFIAWTQMNPPI